MKCPYCGGKCTWDDELELWVHEDCEGEYPPEAEAP